VLRIFKIVKRKTLNYSLYNLTFRNNLAYP